MIFHFFLDRCFDGGIGKPNFDLSVKFFGVMVGLSMESSEIDWIQLGLQLLGGLALFLLGMEELTASLRAVAGGHLKKFLAKATKNRFLALVSGTVVTAAAQSSSITTVLLVGFCSVGLLSLSNSVGIILGANLGSTVTAQIIAFNVTQWGLLLVAIGFAMRLIKQREKVRYVGGLLLGLGLIFFGMELMSEATRPLRDYQPFVDLMAEMTNPAFGILCGLLFTALVQSSAAATGLTIVLATEGFLSLPGAIAVVLGSNVGTCVTALMAAVGQPRIALRVAMIHVLFNVGGVLIWLPFLPYLADIALWMTNLFSPGSGDDVGRAVANAHTVFNFINAFLFLGFTGLLVSLVEKMIPERDKDRRINRFLDDYYLSEPETALGQVRAEVVDFLQTVSGLHRDLSQAIGEKNEKRIREFDGADDEIDRRQEDLLRFLGRLAEKRLTGLQQAQSNSFVGIVNQIENLGDLLDHVFQGLGIDLLELESGMSDETSRLLLQLTDGVQEVFARGIEAVRHPTSETKKEVVDQERGVRQLVREAKDSLSTRLANRDDERLRIFRIEVDMIECQSRVAHILAEIAREIRLEKGA
ncbi:Na/Pi cotransporter family protein [Puniceicoccus vermicola]|uniref:Na/Pi cotransporter family protein n=1 Tax=Puniceicoccus vermicola TaxID=388746 RepID=A0A7X1AW88_9BACT|nr:Na/Pi cotransporter family protein [Puniceicoccus vermicola]MBC2600223.1 Na/Pi cotransporter family protein [Puniceicoccus vermicola]